MVIKQQFKSWVEIWYFLSFKESFIVSNGCHLSWRSGIIDIFFVRRQHKEYPSMVIRLHFKVYFSNRLNLHIYIFGKTELNFS